MSSCALHLHTCLSHAFEHFPRCPFCIPVLRYPPVVISSFLSCVGIKHFRIGPRLAKWPWLTTGRPPVKFRTIWTSFDTPTVNRGTEKALCVLQPNTPPIWPKTHLTLLHHLERSITIAWPKTAPYLDSPSSLYLYLKPPPVIRGSPPSQTLEIVPVPPGKNPAAGLCPPRRTPPRGAPGFVRPGAHITMHPRRHVSPAGAPEGPKSPGRRRPRSAARLLAPDASRPLRRPPPVRRRCSQCRLPGAPSPRRMLARGRRAPSAASPLHFAAPQAGAAPASSSL